LLFQPKEALLGSSNLPMRSSGMTRSPSREQARAAFGCIDKSRHYGYRAAQAESDTMLTRLPGLSDDHFGRRV
jgi:hypothetical protein